MLGDHSRLNSLLVPGIHVDAGVGGFHAELGLSRNCVGFRPLIRAGEWSGCQASNQGDQDKALHNLLLAKHGLERARLQATTEVVMRSPARLEAAPFKS